MVHHVVFPKEEQLIGEIFQHDNDTKLSANTIKVYLEQKTADAALTVLDWPPQHNWNYGSLGQGEEEKQVKSKEVQWQILKETFWKILSLTWQNYMAVYQSTFIQFCILRDTTDLFKKHFFVTIGSSCYQKRKYFAQCYKWYKYIYCVLNTIIKINYTVYSSQKSWALDWCSMRVCSGWR